MESHSILEEVVYGEINESLVFVKKKRAQELRACYLALRSAKTWGEFRSAITPDDYSGLIRLMDAAISFGEFLEKQLKSGAVMAAEEARSEFMELSVGERLPEDGDPFSRDQVPWTYDADWPDWPAQEMLEWVPKNIRERYGDLGSSRLNGEFLTFSPSDARKITAAFRHAGYRCTKDQKLVEAASGY